MKIYAVRDLRVLHCPHATGAGTESCGSYVWVTAIVIYFSVVLNPFRAISVIHPKDTDKWTGAIVKSFKFKIMAYGKTY